MKLRDMLNQWAGKNPGWLVVLVWLFASLEFYIVVWAAVYLMAVADGSTWLLCVICAALSGGILGIWHIFKEPKFKLWQWAVLFLGLSVLLVIAAFLLGMVGAFIMSGPVQTLICSLIAGGIITGAMLFNTFAKKP